MNPATLSAEDAMVRTIHTADPDEPLRTAAQRMRETGVHCLMVPPSAPNRAPAILTAKDIVQILGDADPAVLDALTVADAMTSPAITVPHCLCLVDCINIMRMAGVRRVFVLDGATPAGVLSYTDILRLVIDGAA